jgi:predicted component of type VI protein secretion system
MPAQLVALTEGPSILLDKPILLFGRHPECDIQIESRKISRRHCCLAQVGDYLVVRDLGSTNGIRINGVRVLEGRLRAGDELTIGGHRYKVCWDAMQAAAVRAELAARPQAVGRGAGEEDDLLESCDEPVALNEDEGAMENVPTPRRSDPRSAMAVPPLARQVANPPPAALPHSPGPQILPENMELAPVSDLDLPKQVPPVPPPRIPSDG